MAELRKVLVLLVMFAVIVSPDWTQSQSAGDPIEVFWSYKNTESFEATVGPESPLHGNRSELSLSPPFSNGHRRKGKVDTVVSVFERSELSRMKRSLTSKEDLGRIVFGGSVRIVDGYTWSEDLLFSNTSFYRDLEAQVILMLDNVFGSTSVSRHYAGASVIQFSFGSIVVHFTVSFTMDTDNGTTIADTSLTGPNITRLFLEAASNLSSNYSLDTNDTMLLEILVSTDSTYTTSMWTALLSTDLQLVSDSDTTSSVPTNASISSPVTPSSPHSTMLSSASELEQSSSRSDHVQESLHTIMDAFGASSSPAGESSETSSSTFAESDLSVSLSSFSPLASTMTIGLSMSDIVAPGGKETSYVALESKETLSLPLQATVTRSYSSSALEGYLIQATSTLPHNYTTSVLTEKSSSPELGETVFPFSSLSSTASMPLEYSRGVSTAAGFSQDHFSSEVSQKYVLLSSPQDTLAQEFQKTPALSASNVFLEATSFDLELMLMPSSSSSPLESTGGILGIVSSASLWTTLELKSEAMSSMLVQRELSLSSITHSGASAEELLSTGAPSMVLQSAFTQELETTVRSVLNVTAVPPTSTFSIEGVSTEERKASWSIHYSVNPSFTDSYMAADFTSFSLSSAASSLAPELKETSSPAVTSVSSVITSTIGTVIPSSVAPSTTTSSEMPSSVPFVITSIAGSIITSSVSPVLTSSESLVITSSVVSANTSSEAFSFPPVKTLSSVPAITSSEISSSVPLGITSSASPTTAFSVMTSIASPVSISTIFPESPKTSSVVATSTLSDISSSVPLTISSSPAVTSTSSELSSDVPFTISSSELSSSTPLMITSSVVPAITSSGLSSSVPLMLTSSAVATSTLSEFSSSVPLTISSSPAITSTSSALSSGVPFTISSSELSSSTPLMITSSAVPAITSSVPLILTSSAVPTLISSERSSSVPLMITSSSVLASTSDVPLVVSASVVPTIRSSVPSVVTSSVPLEVRSSTDSIMPSAAGLEITSSSVPASTSKEILSSVPSMITSSAVPIILSSLAPTTTTSSEMPSSVSSITASIAGSVITSSIPSVIISSLEQVITSSLDHVIYSSAVPAKVSSEISSSVPLVIISSAAPASLSSIAVSSTSSGISAATSREISSEMLVMTSVVGPIITSSVSPVITSSVGQAFTSSVTHSIPSSAPLAYSSSDISSSVPVVIISSVPSVITSSVPSVIASSVPSVITSSVPLVSKPSADSIILSSVVPATSSVISETTPSDIFATPSIAISSSGLLETSPKGTAATSAEGYVPTTSKVLDVISTAVDISSAGLVTSSGMSLEVTTSAMSITTSSLFPKVTSSVVPVDSFSEGLIGASTVPLITSSPGPVIISSTVPAETASKIHVTTFTTGFEGPSLVLAGTTSSIPISSAVNVITQREDSVATSSLDTRVTSSTGPITSAVPIETSAAVPLVTSVLSVASSEASVATSSAVPFITSSSVLTDTLSGATLSSTDLVVSSTIPKAMSGAVLVTTLSEDHTATLGAVPTATSTLVPVVTSSTVTIVTSSPVSLSSAVPIASSTITTIPISSEGTVATSSASTVTPLSLSSEVTSSVGLVATSGFASLVTSSIASVAASSVVSTVAPISVPVATSSVVPVATSSAVPVVTSSAVPVATSSAVPVVTSSAVPVATSSAVPVVTSSVVPVAASSAVPVVTSSAVPVATSSAVPVVTSSAVPVATSSAVPVVTSSAVPVATSSAVPVVTSSVVPVAASSAVPTTSSVGFVTSSASTVATLSVSSEATSSVELVATSGFAHLVTSTIGSVAASSVVSTVAPSSVPVTTSSAVPVATSSAVPVATSSAVPVATSSAVPVDTSSAVPVATSSAVPVDTSSAVPVATSSVVPVVTSSVVPVATSSAVPVTISSAVPVATSSAVPVTTSSAVPVTISSVVPVATSSAVLVATSSAVPVTISSAVPVATSSAVPVATSSAVPVVTSSAVPVATSSAVPVAISSKDHVEISSELRVTSSLNIEFLSSRSAEASTKLTAASSIGPVVTELLSEMSLLPGSVVATSLSASFATDSAVMRSRESEVYLTPSFAATSSSSFTGTVTSSLRFPDASILSTGSTSTTFSSFSFPSTAVSSSSITSTSAISPSASTGVVTSSRRLEEVFLSTASYLSTSLSSDIGPSSKASSLNIFDTPTVALSSSILHSDSGLALSWVTASPSTEQERLTYQTESPLTSTSTFTPSLEQHLSSSLIGSTSTPFTPSPSSPSQSRMITSSATSFDLVKLLEGSSTALDLSSLSSVQSSSFSSTQAMSFISTGAVPEASLSSVVVKSTRTAAEAETVLYSSLKITSSVPYSTTKESLSDTLSQSSLRGTDLYTSALFSSIMATSSDTALFSDTGRATSSDTILYSSIFQKLSDTASYSRIIGTSSDTYLYSSTEGGKSSESVLYSSSKGSPSSDAVLYPSTLRATSLSDTVLYSSIVGTSTETVLSSKSLPLSSFSLMKTTLDGGSDISTSKVFQGTSDSIMTTSSPWIVASSLPSAWSMSPSVTSPELLARSSTGIIFQGIASSFAETTYLLSTTTGVPVEGSSVPPSESSAIFRTTDEMTYAPTSDVTTTTPPKTSTTTTTTVTTTARSSQESSSGSQVLEPSTFFSTTRTTTSSTPTTPPSDVAENDGATKTFQGNMRVVNGASFSEDLLDKNSDAYKQMEAEIMAFIMKVLEQCGLSQRVGSIQITGFRSGSVIVIFTVDITYESATDLTATFLEGYQSLNQTNFVLDESYTEVKELLGNQSSSSPQMDLSSSSLSPSSEFLQSLDTRETSTTALNSALFTSSVAAPDCSCDVFSVQQNCTQESCTDKHNCSSTQDLPCSSVILAAATSVTLPESYFIKKSSSMFSVYTTASTTPGSTGDPCVNNPCPLHSQCQGVGYSYTCTCDPGYSKQSDRCVDIDECLSYPCPENGVCTNTAGGFFCFCRSGFVERGDRCEDVDECASGLCPLHSNCTNTIGSFLCNCWSGFQLSNGLCINVDECSSSPCSLKATCIDNVGSFSCECLQGYMMENNSCSDIDECSRPDTCRVHSQCHNTDGGYNCTCSSGYQDTGGVCTDVDECRQNPCPPFSVCENFPGSFDCQCAQGFYNQSGQCMDIDECQDPVTYPCQQHAVCENLRGSYLCTCLQGFVPQGGACQDVNECIMSSVCPALSECQNTEGNYSCVCQRELFQVDPYTCTEAKTFELLFPSTLEADNLTLQVDAELRLNLSSQFLGITLSSGNRRLFLRLSTNYSGGTLVLKNALSPLFDQINFNYTLVNQTSLDIVDVDECKEVNWTDCSTNGSSCKNTVGGYTCECSPGFVDYSDSKRPGRLCLAIDNNHQQPIKGLAVTVKSMSQITSPNSKYQVGDKVVFTLTMTEGSHVKFRIQFGDGGADSLVHPNIISYMSSVSLNYTYERSGVWTAVVNASNAVSYMMASTNVKIIEPVRNLILNTTEISQSPASTYLFTVALKSTNLTLEDVACKFDFGDGQSETRSQGSLTQTKSISTTHGYNIGIFDITVVCSNNISAQSLNTTAKAEEVISGLKVSTSTLYVRVGDFFYITVETAAGSNILLRVDLGDGRQETYTLGNNRRGSSVIQMPVKYSQVGRYSVSLSAENLLSRATVALTNRIRVLNIVKDLVLVAPGPVAYPPGRANLAVVYSLTSSPPSDVSCEIIAEFLFSSVYTTNEISVGNNLTLPLTFTDVSAVGVNSVTVNCSNPLSYQVLQADVLVQAVVEEVAVRVNQTYIMVKGAVDVNISVGFGSHAQYILDFGDGSNFSGVFVPTVVEKKVLTIRHAFEWAGLYTVTLSVFNRVSSSVARAMVGALEEVTDVSLSAWYQPLDNNDTLRGGHGSAGDVFPLEREIILVAALGSGNDITYTWSLGDGGQPVSTRDKLLRHTFRSVGRYQVSVNASNALFYGTATTVVTLHQTVLMHTLTNNGPTDAYRTIRFTLTLARLGTDTCFVWNMGDGSEDYVFGERSCAKYTNTSVDKFSKIPSTLQVIQDHMYRTNDTFYVKVLAKNLVSEGVINNIAVISGVSCHYPQVHIAGGGQQIDKPVTRLKSQWISIESTVDINCQVTQQADYFWKTERVLTGNNFLDFKFEVVSVDSISAGLFKILYTAGVFELGTYRISLNVSMKGIPGLFQSHFTYLLINPTPLVAYIRGGASRTVGYDKVFFLDAISDSYDPDQRDLKDKTGLAFQWYCQRAGETLPDNPPVIVIPTNVSQVDFRGQGGCFGTGPGKLPVGLSGSLQANSFFLQFKSVNVFTVEVRKDNRLSTYVQAVTVVDGDPPQLNIECVINCNSKVNPSGEFTLLVRCLQCRPTDRITFQWSLFLESKDGALTSVAIPDNATSTGLSSPGISFKPSYLKGGLTYRLRVDGVRDGYAPGYTEYVFVTNLPPYGGNCWIFPQEGFALDTLFVINCSGWLNPGEESSSGRGLIYRFWISPPGQSNQLLYYGTDPFTPESKLPLGLEDKNFRYDVTVRIANPIGEYIQQVITVKVTRPTVMKSVDSLLNLTLGGTSRLSMFLATGREQEAKQMIVALASLLNTEVVARSATTTAATTTRSTAVTTQATAFVTQRAVNITGTFPVPATSPISLSSTTTTTSSGTVTTTAAGGRSMSTTTTAQTSTERSPEEKQKLTELRTEVVKSLAKTTALTLDSLQQTARAVKVITDQTDEISEECQRLTVGTMADITVSFSSMVAEERTQSIEQEMNTAGDIVATLGNVLLAATKGVTVQDILILSLKDASTDGLASVSTMPTNITTWSTSPDSTSRGPSSGVLLLASPSVSAPTSTTEQPALNKREQVRLLTQQTMALADVVAKTVLQRQVPGAPPVVLSSRLFTVTVARNSLSTFNNSVHSSHHGSFVFPSAENFPVDNITSFLDTQFVTTNKNPYIWDASAKEVTSPVLSMKVYDELGTKINVSDLSQPIKIEITTGATGTVPVSVIPFLTGDADLYYHVIDPQWNMTEALSIDLKPLDRHVTLEAFFKWGSSPTATDYDFYRKVTMEEINEDSPNLVFIRSDDAEHNFTNLYMGIRKYVNVSLEEPDYTDYYLDLDTAGVRNESLPPYSVTFFTSSCRFWNERQETWSSDGCEVSAKSTAEVTQCLCSHLTSFASGVFVAPNAIHFDTVFVSLDNKISDNFSVLVTLCLTFGVYIVGLVWARRMDRKDVEKWGATPLADNVMTDKYFYKLTVFTGMRRGAGTRSRVSFILAGDYSDTGVRQLVDETGKKTLSRGSINQYILGVPETLGSLMYLRLWHDSSGKGRHQGWYLNKVIATDLQNGTSYIFLCNRWLAVEEDDGKVDRMLPVAGREDLIDFNHLFFTETRRSLSDNHLWLSVFSRPRRSSFSRVQRLSCILCLLLATMMADAMFYQAGGDPDTASGALEIGPIKVTLRELYVSFVSSLIILPLNVVIDQLFRRSRPRDRKTAASMAMEGQLSGPPASLSEASAGPDVSNLFRVSASRQEFSSTPFPENEPGNSSMTSVAAPPEEAQEQQEYRKDSMMKQSQKNPDVKVPSSGSKFMLPHACVYLAWMLVAAVSGVSAFIIFSYSMEWGRDKSIAWLLAMFLSVGQSVTLIQPVKILLQALLIAWACKSPTDRDTDIEVEEVLDASQVHLMPEEIMEYMPKMARRPHLSVPPPDPEVLNTCRERRLKELAMQRLTVEIFAYLTYLFLLTVIARNNSDIYRFLWTNNIQNFLNSGPTAVEEVRQVEDFWTWTQMAMVPFLYAETDFHGQPLSDGNGLIVSSLDAYRVGPVRLRQHRVTKDTCLISQPFSPSEVSCTQSWSWESEDTAAYSVGWKTLRQDFMEEMNSPWTHRDWTETDGLPYVGDISAYPPGGYIKDLVGKKERVSGFLSEMQSFQWLDKYTRSVFVEFILYNPNVNLFACVTVVFETPVTGSLQGKIVVSPFRLYSDTGGYGVVVIICETLAIIWTIYFLQREGRKVWQERSVYIRKFWNWIELGTLLGSVTAIVMYVGRHLLTITAMKKVKSLKGKYYNFQRLALWNELFSYVLAFVTFLAVLKTLHLLRFNRRLSMLGTTLLRAAKDLFSFSIVFTLVVLSFTAFGFLLFCSLIPDYSTFIKSLETLLAVSLGQSQFQILQEANFVIGPVFCFLYIFFVFFVLLNMFVTILSETFSAVRQDVTQQSNDYEILEFMWSRFWEWVGTTPFKLSSGSKDTYISRDDKAETSVRHPRDSFDDISTGPLTTMSILNLMLRHLETDFDGLSDGPPRNVSSVLKIVPGYPSFYADDNFSLYDSMEVTSDDEKKEA